MTTTPKTPRQTRRPARPVFDRGWTDALASILVPGWTQVWYFLPKTGAALLALAIAGWTWRWEAGLAVHTLATLHAAALVGLHKAGIRPATPLAFMARHQRRIDARTGAPGTPRGKH